MTRLALALWVLLAGPLLLSPKTGPSLHGPTPEFLRLKASLEDPAQGWARLFEGKDLGQWQPQRDPKRPPRPNDWKTPALVRLDTSDSTRLEALPFPSRTPGKDVERAAPAFVNNRRGKSDNLITVKGYRDVELYLEFMVPRKSNSGVCLMGIYEIQIYDSYGRTQLKYGDNGGIYAQVVDGKRVGGEPPRINASRPPGEWQSFHIWFRAPRFDEKGRKIANARFLKVEHNGTLIHGDFELPGSTRAISPWSERPEAPILLQGDHGPVAFRNLHVRPLRGD